MPGEKGCPIRCSLDSPHKPEILYEPLSPLGCSIGTSLGCLAWQVFPLHIQTPLIWGNDIGQVLHWLSAEVAELLGGVVLPWPNLPLHHDCPSEGGKVAPPPLPMSEVTAILSKLASANKKWPKYVHT